MSLKVSEYEMENLMRKAEENPLAGLVVMKTMVFFGNINIEKQDKIIKLLESIETRLSAIEKAVENEAPTVTNRASDGLKVF